MSQSQRVTRGTCALCHESLAKRGASRHLAACLARQPVARSVPGFHLLVEGGRTPQYWMHVAARADATLGALDAFLRGAWLECCGHLSEFRTAPRGEALGMGTKLGGLLRPDMTFLHEYDFGSTTQLKLRVVGQVAHQPKWKAVELLALNDAPSFSCSVCGKAAQVVDTEDYEPLCEACARTRTDMALPLVNSPRVGVCGYTGPAISIPTLKAG